jgi:hypothetical protein
VSGRKIGFASLGVFNALGSNFGDLNYSLIGLPTPGIRFQANILYYDSNMQTNSLVNPGEIIPIATLFGVGILSSTRFVFS